MPSYATSKQMTSPMPTVRPSRSESSGTYPGSVPGSMSRVTRSTAEENWRTKERMGMYSANGAGCCLV